MSASENQGPLDRPLRVIVFTGGPGLQRDVELFLERVETHPEVELLGVLCESAGQNGAAIWRDLWRRRGVLAVPLLALRVAHEVGRDLLHPLRRLRRSRQRRRSTRPVHFVDDLHDAEVLEQVRALHPDLGLIYGGPILEPVLYQIPTFGTLGIHHGSLPHYRGKKTTFWAMYHGETTAGVAIQRIGRKLDGGDIVKQGEVTIRRRSLAAVKRELEKLGHDLYLQAVLEVKRGTATFRPQPGSRRRPFHDPRPRDLLVFGWRQMRRRLLSS